MSKCQWPNCDKDADKVLSRPPTDEEYEKSKVMHEQGVSWVGVITTAVCNDHLEEARRIFPFDVNQAP
jgi:hypothetical protein